MQLGFIPDSKNPVEQKSPKEAEDNIWPGVPGVQLHELCSVQVQVLETGGKHYSQDWFSVLLFLKSASCMTAKDNKSMHPICIRKTQRDGMVCFKRKPDVYKKVKNITERLSFYLFVQKVWK